MDWHTGPNNAWTQGLRIPTTATTADSGRIVFAAISPKDAPHFWGSSASPGTWYIVPVYSGGSFVIVGITRMAT